MIAELLSWRYTSNTEIELAFYHGVEQIFCKIPVTHYCVGGLLELQGINKIGAKASISYINGEPIFLGFINA